jgi:type IV pilus assembly protein PilB
VQSPEGPTVSARWPRIGQILLETGALGPAQLNAAMVEQHRTHRPLGEILLEHGYATPRGIAEAVAISSGTPFVDLDDVVIDERIARCIPEHLARRLEALPIEGQSHRIVLAMADPYNVLALDDVHMITGREISSVAVEREQLLKSIDAIWHREGRATLVESEQQHDEDRDAVEENETVQLVFRLLHQAVAERASDIHVESMENGLIVRFRVDGVLHDVIELPRAKRNTIIARIKVMTAMDISDHRVPQDGRMTLIVDDRSVDVRAVSLPTAFGESIVLRILDRHQSVRDLQHLELSEQALARLSSSLHHSWGLVLVTGPTGSGKTTTLYAGVADLNDRQRNIVTIEDPIEFLMPGIKQMQVNRRGGLTFARALRSILRADPDVILVGEIRDLETVQLAAEAALTGHLVLSTLHTNDAASTPMRLLEMGLEPYLITSALDCVIAQRLVRRLCTECKEKATAVPESVAQLDVYQEIARATDQLWRARGCAACNETGFQGRFPIFEVLTVTDAIRQHIVEQAPVESIRRQAIAEGMETLRTVGARRVASGDTSVEELVRVLR